MRCQRQRIAADTTAQVGDARIGGIAARPVTADDLGTGLFERLPRKEHVVCTRELGSGSGAEQRLIQCGGGDVAWIVLPQTGRLGEQIGLAEGDGRQFGQECGAFGGQQVGQGLIGWAELDRACSYHRSSLRARHLCSRVTGISRLAKRGGSGYNGYRSSGKCRNWQTSVT